MNTATVQLGANIARLTFRNLPQSLKKHFNVYTLSFILREKSDLYATLTYSEKCLLSNEILAFSLQKRLLAKGKEVGFQALNRILQAEQRSFQTANQLYFN